MKRLTITAILLFASATSFAQDNTLPTTGNVGVGTLTPSARLDVNGNAIIDSCLLIKDSLQVNKTIRTMGKMFVEQKMTMKGNAVVKQNFRVNGNSRIDGNIRTFGNSRIEGLLKLPNTTFLSNNNVNNGNFDFLVLNANGTAKKVDYDSLVAKIGGGIYNPAANPPCKYDINTPVPSPKWSNGVNKIFTSCPQVFVGIGTDEPLFSLDVRGETYITKGIGIGIQPNIGAQVYVSSSRPVGYCVDHTPSVQYGYSFKAIVNDEQTKGIGIYSSVYGKDVFTVYSDGKMVISNATNKILQLESSGLLQTREVKVNVQSWPDYVFNLNYKLMPLSKVESFIQREGHLPNIPSASAVESDGLNLGEMNKLLLEKIEELTLYVIEQDKRLKELEQKSQ